MEKENPRYPMRQPPCFGRYKPCSECGECAIPGECTTYESILKDQTKHPIQGICGDCKFIDDKDISQSFGEDLGMVFLCSEQPYPVRKGQIACSKKMDKENPRYPMRQPPCFGRYKLCPECAECAIPGECTTRVSTGTR